MPDRLSALVAAVAKAEGWKQAAAGPVFELVVPLQRNRLQKVAVQIATHEGETFIQFNTVVGDQSDLTPSRYEKALEVNYHLPYGRLAIHEGRLLITDLCPLAIATPESSARLIRFIARQADLYENAIFKQDVH
jgi:hypothetical protein